VNGTPMPDPTISVAAPLVMLIAACPGPLSSELVVSKSITYGVPSTSPSTVNASVLPVATGSAMVLPGRAASLRVAGD